MTIVPLIPNRPDIGEDTPLRLAEAAELAYPGGGMTASGLRRERDAGRLTTELVAGKEYVTLRAIAEMRELCKVRRKSPFVNLKSDKHLVDEEDGIRAHNAVLLRLNRLRKS